MSNSGGSALARTRGVDRFYNPPAARRNQQLSQRRQRPLKSDARVGSLEKETPNNSDESTLSRPNSVGSSSTSESVNLTNLDRFMSSVTPFVQAQILSEPKLKGCRNPEVDGNSYFCLGDLWDSFREWSAYGVEVPLLINGNESVKQYYVPYLSGIQLYVVDPHVLRKPHEDSVDGASNQSNLMNVDGASNLSNLMNVNSERLGAITLRDKPLMSSSSDETEVCNSPGMLVFEFFDWEQPHFRPPIFDKVGSLASQFPDLKKYRSCDLLPSSWFSVAWYPIYRIPVGSTLRSLEASFLTFHTLSTHPRSKSEPQFYVSRGEKVPGAGASLKISLPSFGLASYKLRGSILSPTEDSEWQQANSLVQAAGNWLQSLKAKHPDYQFFINHSSRWR